MKKTLTATLLAGATFATQALAHPHHGTAGADHLHFSVSALLLVGLGLGAYWMGSRYLRERSQARAERSRQR